MNLNETKDFSINAGKAEFIVCIGWRERSSGEGREYIMLNHDMSMKLLTDKGDGTGVNIRPECSSKYSHAEVKEMKKTFNSYIKDIKSHSKVAAAV